MDKSSEESDNQLTKTQDDCGPDDSQDAAQKVYLFVI